MKYDCRPLCADFQQTMHSLSSVLTVLLVAEQDATDQTTYDHLPEMTLVSFSAFKRSLSNMTVLKTVLTPLVSDEFDAFEVATVLSDAGFRGELRAFGWASERVPQIRREIAESFPDLDFGIISRDRYGRINLT